jgi:predicted dehydrogenase
VMVEKPVTLSAEEGWDLERRVRERGVVFLAPYGWNYKPFTVEAKRLVDEGLLGGVQYVLCHMASPTRGLFAGDTNHIRRLWESRTSGPDPQTWQSPEHGGGYAHGQITHSSALLFWLFDTLRAASVTAKVSTAGAAVDLFDAAVVTFDGGAIGTVSGAATLPDGSSYQVDVRVFGSEGVLLLDTERERVTLRRYDGREWNLDIEPGAGDYECIAARSIELIDAMLRSAAAGGTEVTVQEKEPAA